MCLIVAKPQGIPMPSHNAMKIWFKGHPDGFGLAFRQANEVTILKGAMGKQSMHKLLKKMKGRLYPTEAKDVDIVFHFRQATSGSISPENCHPFPLSDKEEDFKSLDLTTNYALAHNGIIWDYFQSEQWDSTTQLGSKTDTQTFIETHLVGLGNNLWSKEVQEMIADLTSSRFVLLSKRGITYIGQFLNDKGCFYSNSGYQAKPSVVYYPRAKSFSPTDSTWKEESADEEGGGIVCDFCHESSFAIYEPPSSESWVCAQCFEYLVGRRPSSVERAY